MGSLPLRFIRGVVILMEALNSSSEREEASGIPNPPSLAGSASNFLIESFGGG